MAGLATVATVGIVMVIAPNASTSLGQGSFLGDGLVLAGTFFAAVYVIATRRLVDAMPPLPLSALQQSVGLIWTLGTIAAALAAGLVALGLNGMSIPVLLLAALSGIVQYALAFWLYLFALRRLPASVAAFALALIPVFGVAAAYVFLGEGLDKMQWIGAALIVASVALASCLQED